MALVAALTWPALAGDAVVLVEEKRTRESGKKQLSIRHVAVITNTSWESVRALRVTVELRDYFDKILWARTVIPTPSALEPGDTATLSLMTPSLDAHRKTRYRFDYSRGTGHR